MNHSILIYGPTNEEYIKIVDLATGEEASARVQDGNFKSAYQSAFRELRLIRQGIGYTVEAYWQLR